MLKLENELKEIFESYFDIKNVKDIFVVLKVTKQQAKAGTIKHFTVNRRFIGNSNTDYLYKKEIEKITIPADTKNGTVIKINGKGNQIENGEYGNLYVKIKIFGRK